MNYLGKKLRFKFLAGGLLATAVWLGPAGPAAAQNGEAADQVVPQTITIVKEVDVYEFEDMKVSVDQYQVVKGDSLVKLFKSRGLLTSGGRQEQAKLIRLVRSLNPDVKDLNNLSVGQVLRLPSPLAPDAEAKAPEEAAKPPAAPVTVTETVKEYERAQSGQQRTKVKVMVHRPGEAGEVVPATAETAATAPVTAAADKPGGETTPAPSPAATAETTPAPAPAAAETDQTPAASSAAAETTPTTAGSGTAAPQPLDFPSGNEGLLAVEPQSQVVYRTVKVRKGDSLERLLRREGMHRDLIYGQLLKVTLELNPEIKNQNLIYAGAEIRIPAAGNYLQTMAGVDPQEVRNAAAAIAERRRPEGGGAGAGVKRAGRSTPGARAAVLELPDEAAVNAKNTLGLIFTRLGERLIGSGVRSIPSGQEAFELDAAVFPIVELGGGRQLVLDPGSKLNRAAVASLRAQNYQVFQSRKAETLDRALDRLWNMCGYYRIYKKDRTYEGGTDIRLKISADWIVWTTQEAWNAGQPLVVNRAKDADTHSNPAWVRFLEDHGIKLVDIHRNTLLPAAPAPESAAELKVTELNSRNISFLAAELVKNLGVEPKIGVQLDLGREQAEAAVSSITAPVLWERGKDKIVLDFGEMPYDAAQTLQQNGYRLITVRAENEAAIDGVLEGFGLKMQNELVVSAPAGGPKMSLTIKGRLVTVDGKKTFITNLSLPPGLAAIMDPNITILKY